MQIEFDPNTYLTDVLEKLKQNKQLNTFNKDLVALVVNDLYQKYFLCYETIRNVKQLKDLDLSVEKEFNTLFNIKNSYAYDIEKLINTGVRKIQGVGRDFDVAPYIPPINIPPINTPSIPPYRKIYPYPNIVYNTSNEKGFSEYQTTLINGNISTL